MEKGVIKQFSATVGLATSCDGRVNTGIHDLSTLLESTPSQMCCVVEGDSRFVR